MKKTKKELKTEFPFINLPMPDTSQYWIDMLENREGEKEFKQREAKTKKVVKRLVKKMFK